MDKPKCRLCGHKHWGDEHVWPETGEPMIDNPTEKISHEKRVSNLESPVPKKKFDRVAYQREYMRKRRAKKEV